MYIFQYKISLTHIQFLQPVVSQKKKKNSTTSYLLDSVNDTHEDCFLPLQTNSAIRLKVPLGRSCFICKCQVRGINLYP